jgi:hypothetical protein
MTLPRTWYSLPRPNNLCFSCHRRRSAASADFSPAPSPARSPPRARNAPSPDGLLFGTPYYFAAIVDTPSKTAAWQWQSGGHQITINTTTAGFNISLTPSIIGVQPVEYTDANGNTVRPLADIEDDAFALVNSLDATRQLAAILGTNYILGIYRDPTNDYGAKYAQ